MRIVDTRIKYVADIFGRIGFRGYTEQDVTYEGNGAITLSPSNFHDMKMDYGHLTYLSWDKYYESPEIQIENGDILFVKTGSTYGKSCFVSDLPMEATINPQLIVFKNFKMNAKLFAYVLQTDGIRNQCELAVVGGTIPTMSQKKIGNFQLQIPFYPEDQNAVVKFLDAKCAEIDALAADIQSQIDTLEQYKSSVITEAVTRGLDKNVEMKDSGFDWLGFIPSTWQTRKGKYIFVQRNERGNSIELQLLSPTQKYGVIPQDLYEEISGYKAVKLDEKTDYSLLKTIHKGDYCISLRSFQGGFEYSEYEGVVSPAYQVFYPVIEVFRGYYKHLFKTQIFIDKMNSFTMSLRDGKNIAFADFGNTYLPIPPIQEQQRIADYLDRKCAEIDSIITEKKQQIETIEEYKKSLIFEYVTGKKEVPAV